MGPVWLLIACVIDDGDFGGGGTNIPGQGGTTDDSGDGSGDDSASDDSASDDSASDDSGTGGDCTTDDLEWSTDVTNQLGLEPFYAGDTLTLWAQVTNTCTFESVTLFLTSTCLFDSVEMRPPSDAIPLETSVAGCSTTTKDLMIAPGDIELQAYTWGPLYVAGNYEFTLHTSAGHDIVGSFTLL